MSGRRGLIDWGLAARLAGTVAGAGDPERADLAALERTCAAAGAAVCEYMLLEPPGPLPPPEAVDRREWSDGALATFRELAGDLDQAAAESIRLPGPLSGLARGALGTAAAGEAGTVVGLAARRVLGQYDVSLVGERPARLLFVWPNIAEARRQLGAGQNVFLHWIALHELTHAVQFTTVPWLRDHLGGIVDELIRSSAGRLDGNRLRGAAGRLARVDARQVAGALMRGELIRLLAGPEQRRLLDRAQATMAVLEGHAEHVMDAASPALGEEFTALRRRMDARRANRSGLESVVGRLLGMEMKMRQYRLGKAFCDAVVSEAGVEGLNRVWSGPEALPDLAELERPREWLERVGVPARVGP